MLFITFVTTIILLSNVLGTTDVEFECDDAVHCLNQDYEYQCVVTNQAFLVWTIRESRSTFLGQAIFTPATLPRTAQITQTDNFFVELLGFEVNEPLVSNITITIKPDMNGDIIECAHSTLGIGDIELCTINIAGLPSIDSVTIQSSSFTSSSARVTWWSSSPCVTRYQYRVDDGHIQEVAATNDSEISIVVEDLLPSDFLHCIVVNAIDSGERVGPDSTLKCWLFNVPPQPNIIRVTRPTSGSNTSTVLVTWNSADFCVNGSDTVVLPDLIGYEVKISDSQDPDVFNDVASVFPNITSYTFLGVPNCRTYNIEVSALNVVGRSSLETTSISFPNCFVPTITSTILLSTPSSNTASSNTASSNTASSNTASADGGIDASSPVVAAGIATTTASTAIPMSTPSSNAASGIDVSSPAVAAGIAVAATIPVVGVLSSLLTLLIVYLCARCKRDQSLSKKKQPLRDSKGRNWGNQSSLIQNVAYMRSADLSVVFSGVYETVVET